ncbi:DNA mismatch repair endonuclease MutL [Liberiplasma polymorphum]|uniref:DNA mismatch repair endonuclease MutL n=1 Tax=Liberiplasma polymorphum TaxID=3374570 RepID=UPI0037768618
MGKIIQLDEALSNMIAAGEVVENMASVVKELTENAIDAEAKVIEIHLTDYGLKEIKIIDDGTGMDSDDLMMAFKRHATSKIKTHHDLFHIASLGFRGEALPSIASVSELTIESSTDNQSGRRLTLRNGEITEDTLSSARKGTAITVKNLFYNTPARLKHLKSESKELSMIVDYVNKIALSHADIRFTLTHNKRTILHTNGDSDLLKILYQVYDLDIVKSMLKFEAKNTYFKIKGYVCKPLYNRSSKQHITLIANNRLIKNNRVLSAVVEAFKTYLPIGKYPIAYIEIKVDPLLIDVNIHPQKLEIKFTEENLLIALIKETIQKTLKNAELIQRVSPSQKSVEKPNQTKIEFTYGNLVEEEDITVDDYQVNEQNLEIESLSFQKTSAKKLPDLEYIGQALGTYLLFQNDDGFYMIDQHAAAERIRYERYARRMSANSTITKPLLIPFDIHLSSDEIIAYESYKDAIEAFGVFTTIKDNKTLQITEIPDWFLEGLEEAYTETIIKTLLQNDLPSKSKLIDQLAIDLSCKHSIKANQFIKKEEVDAIIKDLNQTDNPYHCPHGRPTIIHFTQNELEKLFKRIQS